MSKAKFDIAVIGGGASGLAAAISAKHSRSEKTVAVFDSNPRIGKKILATGNGRCNISNKTIDVSFYRGSPDFAVDVIKNAGENAVESFFASLGLRFREDAAGRLYPASNQAASVLDALRFEIERLDIKIYTENKIREIQKTGGGFVLNGEYYAKKVIIATGGNAAPKTGSDGSGYDLLKALNIAVNPVFPALTGLYLCDYPRSLKGLRAECRVSVTLNKKELAADIGEVQFNESGVSGIPVMQISRAAGEIMRTEKNKAYINIDAVPSMSAAEIVEYINQRRKINPNLTAENLLSGIMPKILACSYFKDFIPLNMQISKISENVIQKLAEVLKSKSYPIKDVLGFDSAQVTAGGADTSRFSVKTLESLDVQGLYCCGEILDVDALCGGYNLHWAWCSGIVCGRAAVK